MQGHYSPYLVCLSFLIAILASHSALELSARVKSAASHRKWFWIVAGAVAAGTGIWAMHFVGMLAFTLPIPIGFDPLITLISWCSPVMFAMVAFAFVHEQHIRPRQFSLSAIAMGTAIAGMHYLGMEAMQMSPPIQYDSLLVAVSFLIAVGLSGAALWVMRNLMPKAKNNGLLKLCVATLLGTAIWAMHYTGMWAAHFSSNAICQAADKLDNRYMPYLVSVPTVLLLLMTSLIAYYDRRRLEHQRLAETDALTGLKNRLFLQNKLPGLLARSQSSGMPLYVAYLDLDGFKLVNDTLGHEVGDSVLVISAKRIQECLRSEDLVIRVGGDEFVLVLVNADAGSIESIMDRLVVALNHSMRVGAHNIHVSGSIGIVKAIDEHTAESILNQADTAMYKSKKMGRNTWQYFTADMAVERHQVADIHKGLRQAFQNNEFKLYYQTKHAASSHEVVGLEALIRWDDPANGLRLPDDFIPVAERTGLISMLCDWVFEAAFRQLKDWTARGWRMPIAINISALLIRDPGITSKLTKLIKKYDVDPTLLTFEITESVAIDDPDKAMTLFKELNDLGITISIDDFGTGYSSLNYLKSFPAAELKIDKSFVQNAISNVEALALLKAIINIGHALKMKVVAEGVESAKIARVLESFGCDILQGYFFSEPRHVDEIEEMLAQMFVHGEQYSTSPKLYLS